VNADIMNNCIDVNIVDPTYDPISAQNNFTDPNNQYTNTSSTSNDPFYYEVISSNDYSLCPYEWMYLSYAASVYGTMTNDWTNIFGFTNHFDSKVVLTSAAEFHAKQQGVPPMAIMLLQPSSYIQKSSIEQRSHTVLQALGLLGGLYGCVAGIYIIFFGQRNLNPFGFVQRYFFRKSVNERMSTFRNNSGLPLVNNNGLDLDPEQIAERVRNLEGLLAEYFIDTGYLEQLRKEPVHSSASWSKESASNNVSRPAQVQLPFARTRNASEDSLE